MKSVYQNSIFSKVVNPHLFIDFAFLYLNGMEQNKIEEALNLGHGRGVEWKKVIQEFTEEHNKMIKVQLGGGGKGQRHAQIDGSMFGRARKYGRGTYNHTLIYTHQNKRANTHTLTQTHTLSQSRLVCRCEEGGEHVPPSHPGGKAQRHWVATNGHRSRRLLREPGRC
jgi:hypothetical protein